VGQVEEHRRRPLQELPCTFQGNQRIFEAGWLRIVRDLLDGLQVFAHPLFERWLEVACFKLIEGGQLVG
jgi:hypothetical protein